MLTPEKILSNRVIDLQESATLRMSQLSRDLQAKGVDVINLSIGEPDFDTPEHIKLHAIEALNEGFTKYPPVPGIPELRKAICHKFERDNNLRFEPANIVVSNGAKQSIANIVFSLVNPGDEVIVFSPYWVSYIEIIRLCGGIPIALNAPIEQDFKVTPDQLQTSLTERTKLIMFSSPCNPTGSVYTESELRALAEVLKENERIIVMSDEIYEYINFTHKHFSIGSIDHMRSRTVTVNGFSKGFAMTGWRLGYIGAPKWLAEACNKIQGQFTSGANSFGQKAAYYALESDLTPTRDMCEAFMQRRDIVIGLLKEINGLKVNHPQGAFYIFPDASSFFGKHYGEWHIDNADVLCEYLLAEGHVALVSGGAFGDPNCIRISYAASEANLREAVKRVKTALEKLS